MNLICWCNLKVFVPETHPAQGLWCQQVERSASHLLIFAKLPRHEEHTSQEASYSKKSEVCATLGLFSLRCGLREKRVINPAAARDKLGENMRLANFCSREVAKVAWADYTNNDCQSQSWQSSGKQGEHKQGLNSTNLVAQSQGRVKRSQEL